MADNFVQIKIKASDTAKPDLTDLKAQLADLGSKVETAKVDVDDEDGKAKLLDLNAKLAALNAKAANPKITVAGAARVEAQIAALEAQFDHLKRKEDETASSSDGLKSRLSALGEAANSLTLGISGGWGEMGMFEKVMAGANIATGIGEPLVAGLTVAVGGLASGLVSAGAGLGVFAEVAKSAYSQVSASVTAYQTAMSTTGKASATAMATYKADMAALTPAQRAFAGAINGAENSWQSFVAANTSGVTQILDKGLGLLPKILSAIQPLLAPVEHALSGIIGQLGKGLDSSGFKSFMSALAQNTGPAITKLGDAIGHIAVGIGGILKAFMPVSQTMLGGIDKITGAFAKWGTTLTGHSGFQSLMETFKTETPLAVGVLKNLVVVVKNVAAAMTGLSTGSNSKMLLQVLGPLSGILEKLSKNTDLDRVVLYLMAATDAGKKLKTAFQGIQGAMSVFRTGASALQDFRAGFSNSAAAASAATGLWGTLGGKLSAVTTMIREQGLAATIAAGATKVWTGIQAAFDAVMDANPIVLVVIAIVALIAAVVLAYQHIAVFRDFVKAAMRDVVAAVESVVDWVKGHWPLLLGILTGPIGPAVRFIVDHWQEILNGARSMIDDVVSFFERLPGRILSALAALPGMLLRAGVNAIEALLHGMESMIGGVIHTVEGWGHDIANGIGSVFGIHFSEPSEATQMVKAGQRIAAGLAAGMLSGRSAVAAAARGLSGSAAISPPGGGGYGAAAGGGGTVTLQIGGGGGSGLDALFMTWLKGSVRAEGGDPAMFTRKVKFL